MMVASIHMTKQEGEHVKRGEEASSHRYLSSVLDR